MLLKSVLGINTADRPTLVFNLNSNDHGISNFIEKLDPPLICLSVICWICYLMNHCYFIIFLKKNMFYFTSHQAPVVTDDINKKDNKKLLVVVEIKWSNDEIIMISF